MLNLFGANFCNAFGRAFDDIARELVGVVGDNQMPEVDTAAVAPVRYLFSDKEGDKVVIELPGCKKEDLDVKLVGKYVKVEGKRTLGDQEYKYSTVFMSKNDLEHAKVSYADGVLTVTVPAFKNPEPEVKKLVVE